MGIPAQAEAVGGNWMMRCRGDRAFSVAAPRLWNALPLCIRSASSLSVFKSKLKTHLFELAYIQ